jgi:hypothetical protein
MSTTTRQVIQDYVRRVQESVRHLREHFQTDDLLRGVRERTIPRRGTVDEHGLTFNFHGIGCLIQQPDAIVDFDFGPNGRIGGFDSWRLLQFLESCNDYDTEQLPKEQLESEIQALVQSGAIVAPRLEPSPHLLYLATDDD